MTNWVSLTAGAAALALLAGIAAAKSRTRPPGESRRRRHGHGSHGNPHGGGSGHGGPQAAPLVRRRLEPDRRLRGRHVSMRRCRRRCRRHGCVKNHGQYVRWVAHAVRDAAALGVKRRALRAGSCPAPPARHAENRAAACITPVNGNCAGRVRRRSGPLVRDRRRLPGTRCGAGSGCPYGRGRHRHDRQRCSRRRAAPSSTDPFPLRRSTLLRQRAAAPVRLASPARRSSCSSRANTRGPSQRHAVQLHCAGALGQTPVHVQARLDAADRDHSNVRPASTRNFSKSAKSLRTTTPRMPDARSTSAMAP